MNKENLKLIDRIILNGKVGLVPTKDDNDSTIGILYVIKKVTFAGEEIVDEGSGFALTKEIESKVWGYGNLANVRFVTADTPIDPTKVEEKIIESYYGKVQSEYYHHYTELSGYIYTKEGFKVGGHDIPNILYNYLNKYIHMEIEVYQEKK